ncbi:MAG: hypothetical protein ACYS6W_14270 [Planctomycetota bacterium]
MVGPITTHGGWPINCHTPTVRLFCGDGEKKMLEFWPAAGN